MLQKILKNQLFQISIAISIFGVLLFGAFSAVPYTPPIKNISQTYENENFYLDFVSEIFDLTMKNYWKDISEKDLVNTFYNAIGDNSQKTPETKSDLINLIRNKYSNLSPKAKTAAVKLFVAKSIESLEPAGKSHLLDQNQMQNVSNVVNNINTQRNLYAQLNIPEGAPIEQVNKTYEDQKKQLEKVNTPEAKNQLQQITYAKEVLAKPETKALYDTKKLEPTIHSYQSSGNIAYISITRYAPDSIQEFINKINSLDTPNGPQFLILDLRNNQGGAIDIVKTYAGLFLGRDKLAYQFFQKGRLDDYISDSDRLNSLNRYKQIAVLVNNMTQSSGEMMTASIKKNKIATVVGITTNGWGTVESSYNPDHQIDPNLRHYLFLVHHKTISDTGGFIDGFGVKPDISITDPSWKDAVRSQFTDPEFADRIINSF